MSTTVPAVPADLEDKPYARVLKVADVSEDITEAICIGSPHLTEEPFPEIARDMPLVDVVRVCNEHRICTECMKKQTYGPGSYSAGDAPVFMGPQSPLMFGDLHPSERYEIEQRLGRGFNLWTPLLDILKSLPKGNA
jgi:hypothetical protein